MKDLKVGVSPLTGNIYVGTVTQKGLWAAGKKDITDSAVAAVAEHLLVVSEAFEFDYNGKRYCLSVQPVKKTAKKK